MMSFFPWNKKDKKNKQKANATSTTGAASTDIIGASFKPLSEDGATCMTDACGSTGKDVDPSGETTASVNSHKSHGDSETSETTTPAKSKTSFFSSQKSSSVDKSGTKMPLPDFKKASKTVAGSDGFDCELETTTY